MPIWPSCSLRSVAVSVGGRVLSTMKVSVSPLYLLFARNSFALAWLFWLYSSVPALRVIGRVAVDQAAVELVDIGEGDLHRLLGVDAGGDRAAEVHVVAGRLRMVELGDLKRERQQLQHLHVGIARELLGGRSVGGFVDQHLAGLDRCRARAGFRHEAEDRAVDEHLLPAREPVALGVVRVRHVVGEPLERGVAVGRVFDELHRAGADELEVLRILGRLLGRIDGERRARRGQRVEEIRLHLLQPHRHLERPGRLHLVDTAQQDRCQPDLAEALQRRDHILGSPWSCHCGTSRPGAARRRRSCRPSTLPRPARDPAPRRHSRHGRRASRTCAG